MFLDTKGVDVGSALGILVAVVVRYPADFPWVTEGMWGVTGMLRVPPGATQKALLYGGALFSVMVLSFTP